MRMDIHISPRVPGRQNMTAGAIRRKAARRWAGSIVADDAGKCLCRTVTQATIVPGKARRPRVACRCGTTREWGKMTHAASTCSTGGDARTGFRPPGNHVGTGLAEPT
jgi:hypothetical protein